LLRILLGELSHSCLEWQSEAGGGKTFCLSAFLEVVGLGRFLICHSLPLPATSCHESLRHLLRHLLRHHPKANPYGDDRRKGFEPPQASGSMGRLNVKVVPGSSRNQIVGWLGVMP
jgi:hypothetical protein